MEEVQIWERREKREWGKYSGMGKTGGKVEGKNIKNKIKIMTCKYATVFILRIYIVY